MVGMACVVVDTSIDPIVFLYVRKNEFSIPLSIANCFIWILSGVGNDDAPLVCCGKYRSTKATGFDLCHVYFGVNSLCGLCHRLRKKIEAVTERNKTKEKDSQEKETFSINEIICILGCILFFAFCGMLSMIPEPHFFSFSSALTDLANGSARAYGDTMKERAILYNSGEKDIAVEPLPAQPQLLYFSDIRENPEYWENRGLCQFYGIDSVRVENK